MSGGVAEVLCGNCGEPVEWAGYWVHVGTWISICVIKDEATR